MPRSPRERRRGPGRPIIWLALGASVLVHLVVLGLIVFDVSGPSGARDILLLPLRPEALDVPEARRETPPAETPEAPETATRTSPRPSRDVAPAAETPAVSIPTPAPGAPETATIPQTGLVRLAAPLQPLVATPYGITRRPVVRDEARLARMRAESLVNARIGGLVEAPSTFQAGPVSLANGGVTVPIPWGGFVRNDRDDASWREKRCRGDEKNGDQPGEEEARRTQCD